MSLVAVKPKQVSLWLRLDRLRLVILFCAAKFTNYFGKRAKIISFQTVQPEIIYIYTAVL